MSPRPQIEHIRKPQILAAAAEVITERGLAATRISDIAERAGTSASGVLYWFATKDELLAEALTVDEERFNEYVTQRLVSLRSPSAKLLMLFESCVDDYDWSLWIEVWSRALHDDATRAARQRSDDRWRELLASVIRAGQANGEFARTHNPTQVALTFATLIDGLALQVTLRDPLITSGQMLETCIITAERLLEVDLRATAVDAEEKVAERA
ncbi:MAG TPA: TetR family transcriptional regulator C-terminal domain-containing protein [Solirubrobacterales bacterium]|nr:TetR family transcriptional regulator C-terminal domain-containing protein [Solirubrobacterales bacterium]